jgi:hypothetical protein
MLSVYDRICKLANDASLGERTRLIHCAVLNLTTVDDIVSFTNDYIRHYTLQEAKYEIAYHLGFFEIEDRKLWKKAVGDVIPIDVLYNRSERELYKFFIYVDNSGNELEEFYNEEKGNHQSL